MTLIDGVGDEVVQFVAAVLMVMVATLAWLSTNARPDRYRTVIVMRSRNHAPTLSMRLRLVATNTPNTNTTPSAAPEGASPVAPEPLRENASVIPLQEMDSIVDAEMAMMTHHRLHFYRRLYTPTNPPSAAESSDESEPQDEPDDHNAQVAEMDSIVSAMEAGGDAQEQTPTPEEESPGPTIESNPETEVDTVDGALAGEKILIKLKYLNDTLKEVEGSLDELLKDFKWRHFSRELSAQCRVRLIFNGRVLSEAATLRAQGLSHRAVVHCLVHPAAPPPPRQMYQQDEMPALNAATHELVTETAPQERSWDLENILMTLVSVALTVVWFFRCEYSNMFTASASVALFGLTVFYSVAIFGLYLSDSFQLERRAPPPPPPDN